MVGSPETKTMKRCPVEQGGCGELVEILFNSGLCQKCDAMVAKGTAAVGGVPRRRGGRKLMAGNGEIREGPPRVEAHPEPCRKYVKGPERGICATCEATRAAHLAAKKNGAAPAARKKRGPGRQPAAQNGADDPLAPAFMKIEQLRSTYTDEYEKATALSNAWLAKLEVLDEVENVMRG
jgi:hypothetical protein